MAKRMSLMLSLVALLLAALGWVKFRRIESGVQASSFEPPPEAVTTVVAHEELWPTTMNIIGTTEAVQGVTVSADLPGTVDRINFDSGKPVEKGDILVELDTRQERAQLAQLEAQRDLAHTNFERSKQLVDAGVISRMDYDRATEDQTETEAKVAEVRATIQRKTIRAPFSGILGIRKVNLGQYLAGGSAIVSLQSLNPIYVNFGVPQDSAGRVSIGRDLRINAEELPGQKFVGHVTAIDSIEDETTRNVQVQATLVNPQARLRPGMFVQVELVLGAGRPVIALPATAINYAPYGDSVYIVTDLKDPSGKTYKGVHQQFVKIDGSRGDQVAIISGIKPGDEIVSSGVFKLRNGAAVQINNRIQPPDSPAPKPQDS